MFGLAVVGGVVVGVVLGKAIVFVRSWLEDPLAESAIGLVAPFVIYLVAEEVHGSGVLAVVVAALILGQRSTDRATPPACRTMRFGGPCNCCWSRSRSCSSACSCPVRAR